MADQVLIVARETSSRTPAEIVRSLQLTPVIATTEEEAERLIDQEQFRLVAVSSDFGTERVRAAAEKVNPILRVVELPETNGGDGGDLRKLIAPYAEDIGGGSTLRTSILESFTETLDLSEVVRRIVTVTQEEFGADRAWLLHPITEEWRAKVAFSVNLPSCSPLLDAEQIDFSATSSLIRRAAESDQPVVFLEGDPGLSGVLAERYQIRSALVQILRPREGELWGFALHQCSSKREWTSDEVALFTEIGRYATIALNNTIIHAHALREMAKVSAILDQIPEAAAIYDASGRLERMNVAAQREPSVLFAPDPEGRLRGNRHRSIDGSPLSTDDLPSMRALRGDPIRADYLVADPRTGDDRVVNLRAAPIRDAQGTVIGSVVLSRDVTEERQNAEREAWRRRRAECLANLGLEAVAVQASLENLDETALRVADAVSGSAMIYLYSQHLSQLQMVGLGSVTPQAPHFEQFREFLTLNPYHPGEGLPGTVFQIGRPLLFSDVRANDVVDFGRGDDEKVLVAAMNEQSLVATPIESYGDRVGALIIARSDDRRNFDAEDLEFAQAVAERIGAAAHIHRLTRMSQEGHRAAEELARREVDARARFEAVLETAPVGIAVISADELRFELANLRWNDFAQQFGKVAPDTKILGLRVAEVIPDLEAILKQVAESGEARIDEAIEIGGRRPMYVNRIISAARGRFSGITQSLTILVQDVTEQVREERSTAEREASRRRRAECLATLGLERATLEATFENLEDPARRVAQAIGGTAEIYLYQSASSQLELAGYSSSAPAAARFFEHVRRNPFHPGEGLPGTVFQIGRPLFFSDVRGDALVDFARDEYEKKLIADMHEESLIACSIEAYGDRIGALVLARSDDRKNFDAEDLEFAQAVAERIGAASHIHRLTRISQEGHRAAEELARREVDARVRFEAVLETAPIGIAVISADELRFELANVRWMEFAARFGRVAHDDKVIGLRVAEVIPGFEQTIKYVAESGETRVDEEFEIASRPHSLYITRIISPVRGRFSGITQSITVLVQDVTEQVKAKREIEALARMMAERSARLDSILGSMTDGLWVYDSSSRVVDINQAALTMFGLASRMEAVDQSSFEAFRLRYPDGRPIPPDDLPYARALRGHTVPDYLAIGRHLITGKDLDLSIAAAPIESNGIVGAVLVMRDITALQELDRKKDEFLSVASHELRTPLTTIKGYTQLLAQTVNDLAVEERSTYLNAVLGEIERMMGLISELLDVSRIETNRLQIHPQPVRWVEFLERRATAFRVQHPTRQVRFVSSAMDVIVHADPDRMRQVVDNLLSNAIKYSPDGTEIEVSARLEGQVILTSVADQGIGIPSDEIPRLFERFHRARNVSSRYYGGLGLGLYIARAIVEAHDGEIFVESEEGKGSVFTIRLPLPN